MQILKSFFDFIGYSNLFLAFGAFCSTLQSGYIFKEVADSCFLFAPLNFCAAFFLYNIQRVFQSFQPTSDERLLWYRRNWKYIIIIGILLIFIFARVLVYTLLTYKQSILIYGLLGGFSILYFLPPFELRKVAFLKIFYIALVWVVVCVIVPFLFKGEFYEGFTNLKKEYWFYICSQFFFISAICIPFDIRDIEKDTAANVGSIPVLIGIQKSKAFAVISLLFYLLLAIFTEAKNLLIIHGIMFVTSILLIAFSDPKRHRYFTIYLVDGLIILQTILLYFYYK